MRSAGRQASNLEHGVRIGVTGQNVRSRALDDRLGRTPGRPERRLSGAVPVYAVPDQDVCGVDM